MKRILFILLAVTSTTFCSAAMSTSKVRKETRFLTDKMAYELNLSTAQYNDVYEINYDFIYGIRYLMDDVLHGEEWALNRYYTYLDIRNDDLRWVLNNGQYRYFLTADYFYRPIYTSGNKWQFRVYINYTNHNHFYFPRPHHYKSYCGGHYRTNYSNNSFYRGRYTHASYSGSYLIGNSNSFSSHIHLDFGSVKVRPGTSTPKKQDDLYTTRRSSSSSNNSSSNNSSSTSGRTTTRTSTSTSSSGTRNSSSTNKETKPTSTRSSTSTSSKENKSTTVRSSSSSSSSSSGSSSRSSSGSSGSSSSTRTSSSSSRR